MGYSSWNSSAWNSYAANNVQGKTTQQIYSARSVSPKYDVKNITVRESRDSAANPNSTPIIIALDSTGSMNDVIHSAIANLGTLFAEIIQRQPVSDPHIMAMFFDDLFVHDYPLQATQFESDVVIADQLTELMITGNGGGNGSESSNLPLYFAATRTDCDAFAKGRKGFLFTIGDDGVPPPLTPTQIRSIFGPDAEATGDLSYEALLQMVRPNWEVFNINVKHGYTTQAGRDRVDEAWERVLGERAIPLSDISKLAEVITATLEVVGGKDLDTVVNSYSGSTALVVRNAVTALAKGQPASAGVTTF